MSEQVTMQFGSLELRKTDEGWLYLSEGVGNEPDTWCDATSVLGPFGGLGSHRPSYALGHCSMQLAPR